MDVENNATGVKQPNQRRRNRPPKHVRVATKQAKADGIQSPTIQQAFRHMKKTGRTRNYTSSQRRARKKAKARAQKDGQKKEVAASAVSVDAAHSHSSLEKARRDSGFEQETSEGGKQGGGNEQ